MTTRAIRPVFASVLCAALALGLARPALRASAPEAARAGEGPTAAAGLSPQPAAPQPAGSRTAGGSAALASSQGSPELTVLHVNDVHGFIFSKEGEGHTYSGGMAILKTALDTERTAALERGARSIFLFAGDMFQGTPVVDLTRGTCMVDFFSQLRLTAACLGNHDFDYGETALEERLGEARFPIVDTNIHTHRPLARYIHDALLIPMGPFRVGIVGATTEQTQSLSFPENVAGVEFADVAASLTPAVAHLRERGANLVIAVTHDGVDDDRALARKVQGIDLIVGGHTHTVLATEIHEGGTVIVQTGDNTRFLGEVRYGLADAHARFLSYRLIPVTDPPFKADAATQRKVDTYMQPVAAHVNRVVGRLDVDLPMGLRGDDSPVASLMAQAFLEMSPADLAAVNVGGVRRGLPHGPVTFGQLFELAPFGNTIIRGTLTGAQVRKALERSAAGEWLAYTPQDAADLSRRLKGRSLVSGMRPGRRLSGFLLCAGLTYRFDPRKPEWSRVTDISVGDKPLEDTKTYTVSCSNFLKTGGDGMEEFKLLAGVTQTGRTDRDAMEAYLAKHGPIETPPPVTVVNLANAIQ